MIEKHNLVAGATTAVIFIISAAVIAAVLYYLGSLMGQEIEKGVNLIEKEGLKNILMPLWEGTKDSLR